MSLIKHNYRKYFTPVILAIVLPVVTFINSKVEETMDCHPPECILYCCQWADWSECNGVCSSTSDAVKTRS